MINAEAQSRGEARLAPPRAEGKAARRRKGKGAEGLGETHTLPSEATQQPGNPAIRQPGNQVTKPFLPPIPRRFFHDDFQSPFGQAGVEALPWVYGRGAPHYLPLGRGEERVAAPQDGQGVEGGQALREGLHPALVQREQVLGCGVQAPFQFV